MADQVTLWVRHENRPTEQRTPITPQDACALITNGLRIHVEPSAQRIFPASMYAEVGCHVAPAGSWVDAPADAYILGLKELPAQPAALRHRHIFFGHAFKGQRDSKKLLRRFALGGGTLLDLEHLVDESGRRLVAFGYWAGYVGAALALLHARGRLPRPLSPTTKAALDAALRSPDDAEIQRVLVLGARGRCGSGACAAAAVADAKVTAWDVAETRALDRTTLLRHDMLVNTIFTTAPIDSFVRVEDVANPARRLHTISDVTCDITSPCNALPVIQSATSWSDPVQRLHADPPLDVIAIDNLPSLLPVESSIAFSAALSPLLAQLAELGPIWQRCRGAFERALVQNEESGGFADV